VTRHPIEDDPYTRRMASSHQAREFLR
jgi:hypothetical protein